ncbi:MAG: LLM class flavin-dependent oxidoreductase [Acidimicrobiales bacterium]
MSFGVNMFPTDKAINPLLLAQQAEARGFESIWFPEHSHIPTSRVTPWGGNAKAPPLPEEYWRTYDQFVALGMAAAVTKRIVFGLPPAEADKVLPVLDRHAELAAKYS